MVELLNRNQSAKVSNIQLTSMQDSEILQHQLVDLWGIQAEAILLPMPEQNRHVEVVEGPTERIEAVMADHKLAQQLVPMREQIQP